MHTRSRRVRVVVAVCVVSALAAAVLPAAADQVFFVGEQQCTIGLRVEPKGDVLELTTPTPGPCQGNVTVTMLGTLTTHPGFTCAGGAAEGSAYLALASPNGETRFESVALRAASVGGVVTLTMSTAVAPDGKLHVVGTGHLVQDPSTVTACTESADAFMWTGTLVLGAALVNGNFLNPQGPQPEDALLTSFGAPRDYDHESNSPVVFASAIPKAFCEGECAFLYRSTDGGMSWELLPAEGFPGRWQVIVPPGYPKDNVLYMQGQAHFSVSRDGGRSFQLSKAPASATIAMSPGFSKGDRRMLFGTPPGWEYNADLDIATPLPALPVPTGTDAPYAFDPDFMRTGRFFRVEVDRLAIEDPGGRVTVFSECHGRRCERLSTPDTLVAPLIYVSSTFANDDLIFLYDSFPLWRSADGGRSFARVLDSFVLDMSDDGMGTFYAASDEGVLRSTDDGETWTVLGGGTPLANGADEVLALPGGRVLAAPSFGGGVFCSVNRGATWAPRCSR